MFPKISFRFLSQTFVKKSDSKKVKFFRIFRLFWINKKLLSWISRFFQFFKNISEIFMIFQIIENSLSFKIFRWNWVLPQNPFFSSFSPKKNKNQIWNKPSSSSELDVFCVVSKYKSDDKIGVFSSSSFWKIKNFARFFVFFSFPSTLFTWIMIFQVKKSKKKPFSPFSSLSLSVSRLPFSLFFHFSHTLQIDCFLFLKSIIDWLLISFEKKY